ncbi:hypothetical protein KSW81_001442 [Nannochloris sp. 'desiccata']|nr:hypothetical protein KSW81_001442 [Chlorella desiccata (nom. nud.)]
MRRFLLLLLAVLGCARAVKVAIVGGGIGAASTALHLRELIPDDLDIDVFEQSDRVGGRAFSLDIDGHTIEMGASIFHEDNVLVTKMAKLSNLTPNAPQGSSQTASGDDLFALFDGTSLIFRQSPWRIITLIKLLWRYGLQPCIKEGNQKLAEGTFAAAKANLHLNSAVREITAVVGNRGGSSGGGSAKENKEVESIQKFKITVGDCIENNTDTSSPTYDDFYDAVIIATPFHNHPGRSGNGTVGDGGAFLNITGVSLPTIPRRNYQMTIVTIIKGALRPTFFGLPPGPMPYNSILVTEEGSSFLRVPFNSISKITSTSGFKGLYKIFSKKPMPDTWLSMLFDNGYEVAAYQEWAGAYPAFDPPENYPPFQLSQGLYYANAWENAASAMEMAALGGRNVALLAAQHLSNTKISSNDVSILQRGHSSEDKSIDVSLHMGTTRVFKESTAAAAAA